MQHWFFRRKSDTSKKTGQCVQDVYIMASGEEDSMQPKPIYCANGGLAQVKSMFSRLFELDNGLVFLYM